MITDHISHPDSIYCSLTGNVWPWRIALASVALMLVAQIYLIVTYSGATQLSDYMQYVALAEYCNEHGSWYPMPEHRYDGFIFAPGLINYFILQLKLFGTLKLNMILNLLLNLAMVGMVYSFAKKYYSECAGWWSVAIYGMLYSTWWIVVPAGTEVPFLTLSMAGIWLMLRKKPWWWIVAGLCFAMANWIRPLVVIYMLFGMVLMWFNMNKKFSGAIYGIVMMFVGYGAGVYSVGALSESTCNDFITKSSTGGLNLIYTANDKAYGGVAASLYNDSTNQCFIYNPEKYTYAQKDSIWKSRAINWIKENPGRYAKLYLIKIPGMFVEDAGPDRSVLAGAGMVDAYVHGHISFGEFLPHAIALVAKSLVYYIVLILFACSLWICRKDIFTVTGIWRLLWLGGVAGTCLLAVTPRYHYPFLFVMVMWAAYGFTRYCTNKCIKKTCGTNVSKMTE